MNTACTNTIGSFTCTCNAGYENFTEWVGCVDIDECSKGTNNCNVGTADCWNTPGSFVCTCQIGLVGNPLTGCTDVDECSSPTLNNCASGSISPVYNSETFGGEDMKFFTATVSLLESRFLVPLLPVFPYVPPSPPNTQHVIMQ
jgi:hypothetical protein